MDKEALWAMRLPQSVIDKRPNPDHIRDTLAYWRRYEQLADSLVTDRKVPFYNLDHDGVSIYLRGGMDPENVFDALSIGRERNRKPNYEIPDLPCGETSEIRFIMAELEKVVVFKKKQKTRRKK